MDIYKNIKNAKYYINKLRSDLPKMKSKQQKDFTVDMLNSFITLINTIDALMASDKEIGVVDKLLLGSLYSQMYQSAADCEQIDMKLICRNIDSNLQHSKSTGIAKLVGLLQSHEVTMLCVEDGLTVEALSAVTPAQEYTTMINDLLTQFKQTISWS